ncbi:MAG TPA: GNAT family N-acetyltransferase, partial [Pirellulales bacterium]|nr:GNAT family N-acetyltransferase [Pirellulales bacterium]
TRAEPLAQWLSEFAAGARWHVIAIEMQGQLAAALPLVGRRVKGLVELGTVPSNPWCVCGDLLLDPHSDMPLVLDALVAAVNGLSWPLVWLTPIPLAAPRWQNFAAALDRAKMPFAVQTHYRVGELQIAGPWHEYEARWTANHRRQMHKALRRAQRDGPIELKVHERLEGDEIEHALRRGFAIENRGWKGNAGTSVLRTPGMFELYLRQARCLAEAGQLQLVFLEHSGREIAFEYGFCAKRAYFSSKVGYDPAFAAYSPGQLLRLLLLQRFHDAGEPARIDFWGPLSQATSQWCDSAYPVGRLVVAPRRLSAAVSFQAFRLFRQIVRGIRAGAGVRGIRRTLDVDEPAVAPRACPAHAPCSR